MMTIGSVDGDDAICIWFSDEKLNEARFPLQGLTPVDSDTLSDELLQEIIQGAKPLHKGETVRLKSGGPKLTVGTLGDGEITCIWFVKGKLNRATLPTRTVISTNIEPMSDEELQELIQGSAEEEPQS